MPTWRLRGVAAALSLLLVAKLPAAAQEPIYVRDHRGLQVLVQPIAWSADLIVVREIYRDKGQRRGSTNEIYAYDCTKGVLRYVNPDDDRLINDGEFYEGIYKKAHQRLCAEYKDPRLRLLPAAWACESVIPRRDLASEKEGQPISVSERKKGAHRRIGPNVKDDL